MAENNVDIQNIEDFVATTSTVPTYVPKNFYDQFKIYQSDGIKRLYWYDTENNNWNYHDTPSTATIADDAVYSITPQQDFGKILITDNNAEVGEFLYDISNGAITEIADLNGNFETSTSSLSGTTGTDAKITVSADSANGQIDIENRIGAERTFRWQIML